MTGEPLPAQGSLPKPARWRYALGYAGFTALFLVLVVYAARGPRGSDQYWYMCDTMSIPKGDMLSRSLYPGPLLREDCTVDGCYYIHNSLVLQIVGRLGILLTPYVAWIAWNAAMALGAAAFLAALVYRFGSPLAALLALGGFLLLPITVWQSANVLQEITFGLITATLVFGFATLERNVWGWSAVLLVAALATLCNPLYLPVAAALPVFMVWRMWKAKRRMAIAIAAISLAFTGFVQVQKGAWLPTSFQSSLRAIIVNSVPGSSNMDWHTRVEQADLTPKLLVSKVIAAARIQAAPNASGVFFWPANLLIIGGLLVTWRWWRDVHVRRIAIATFTIVLLTTAIKVLHQNQFRYAIIALPGTFTLVAIALARWRAPSPSSWRMGVVALALLGLLAADVQIVRYLAQDSLQTQRSIEQLAPLRTRVGPDGRVLVGAHRVSESLLLTYAIYPARCLTVVRDELTEAELLRVVDIFEPEYLVSREEDGLSRELPSNALNMELPKPYADFDVSALRVD